MRKKKIMELLDITGKQADEMHNEAQNLWGRRLRKEKEIKSRHCDPAKAGEAKKIIPMYVPDKKKEWKRPAAVYDNKSFEDRYKELMGL